MCIFCDIANATSHLHPEGERKQTLEEEILNVITHAIGLIYILIFWKQMCKYSKLRQFNTLQKVSIFCFCLCSFVMYFNSSTYHFLNILFPKSICLRYVFQRLDHLTIYIMITGCYSCFILSRTFGKGWIKLGVFSFTVLFLFAIIGFLVTIFAPPSPLTDVAMYLAMGWSGTIYLPIMFYLFPFSLIFYLFLGGAGYAIGTICFHYHGIFLNHVMWHIIVWISNIIHCLAVLIALDDEHIKGFKQPWTVLKELFLDCFHYKGKLPFMESIPLNKKEE